MRDAELAAMNDPTGLVSIRLLFLRGQSTRCDVQAQQAVSRAPKAKDYAGRYESLAPSS